MKTNFPYCYIHFFFQTKRIIIKFFILKDVMVLFIKLSVVGRILPIMVYINVILSSECVNSWEFWWAQGK